MVLHGRRFGRAKTIFIRLVGPLTGRSNGFLVLMGAGFQCQPIAIPSASQPAFRLVTNRGLRQVVTHGQ